MWSRGMVSSESCILSIPVQWTGLKAYL